MISTFEIFTKTFHSAALCGWGYPITFWITYLNHTRTENLTSVEIAHFYVFYIAVSGGALSIGTKRHIWFTGRASIFAFLLLLLYYWRLCSEILHLKFSLKDYSNGTLNGFVFEPVIWKSQISNVTQNVRSWKSCGHSSMKRFPLHRWRERSFLCNGEDTKFCFQGLITCP